MAPIAVIFISGSERLLLKQVKRLLLKDVRFATDGRIELLGVRHSAGNPLKGTERGQSGGCNEPAANTKGRQGAHGACPPYLNSAALWSISRKAGRIKFTGVNA